MYIMAGSCCCGRVTYNGINNYQLNFKIIFKNHHFYEKVNLLFKLRELSFWGYLKRAMFNTVMTPKVIL